MVGLDPGDPIRVGLIGHGDAGAGLHGPLIEAAGGYRIVGVATSRAEALEGRWGPPRCSVPEVLAVAEDVDLVVVATPNATHHRLAKLALQAGKAVLVDKPFVTDLRQARELIDLADRGGVLLSVFHNRRLDGDFQLVRRIIASGVLGELRVFQSCWDRPLTHAATGWRSQQASGGGAHWDLGSHLVDQVLQLFGEDAEVRGELWTSPHSGKAPDGFDLQLRYGHLDCELSARVIADPPRPRFKVTGSRGTLIIEGAEPWGDAVGRGRHPAFSGFWDGVSVQTGHLCIDGEPSTILASYPEWDQFYPRLAVALRSGERPEVTGDQAARVVEILHALEAGSPGCLLAPPGGP